MRNFLYLNEEFLTSFVAQTTKGRIEETREEEIESEQKEKNSPEVELTGSIKGSTGFSILGSAEAELDLDVKSATSKRSSDNTSKTIYVKRRHDDIFNDFEFYIEKKMPYRENMPYQTKGAIEVGGYLKDKYKLNFMNFDRIESLFSEELWDTYISHSDKSKFPFDDLTSIRKNLSLLRATIPHNTFLCGENIVIPIDNESFLRGKVQQIGFSFETEAVVVGRVKKLIDCKPQNQTKLTKTLNEIQCVTFDLMKELGFVEIPEPEGLYVIYPIAIFY